MKIISKDLRDGEKLPERHVFNGMGYQGENISPHLAWEAAPEGTKSFVVTCYDPDAPTGSGWWHWVVANIPASTTSLPQGAGSGKASMPAGAIQTRTDFGQAGDFLPRCGHTGSDLHLNDCSCNQDHVRHIIIL